VKAFISLSAIFLFLNCFSYSESQFIPAHASGGGYLFKQADTYAGEMNSLSPNDLVPIIRITASDNNICIGAPITFTADVTNPCSDLGYQWKINGGPVGNDNASYSSNKLNDGDLVTCEISSVTCLGASTIVSNGITMTVSPKTTPNIDITASQTALCEGAITSITFTADPTGGGASPSYQWQVDGANAGTNAPVFTTNALTDGSVVQCIMTSDVGCPSSPTASSSKITIVVKNNINPAISITTLNTTICTGSTVTFNAITANEGTSPKYQWQVNGINAGTNKPVFVSSALRNGDIVNCILTSNASCITNPIAASNNLSISVLLTIPPSLSITPSTDNICQGTPVIFTAATLNGSPGLIYQWQVNGVPAGIDSNIFVSDSLANGDLVNCILLNKNENCNLSVPSDNSIPITVRPVPLVNIIPSDTSIIFGTTIQLNADISGNISNIQWTPPVGLSNTAIANPLVKPLTNTTYQLTVRDADGCEAGSKSVISVFRKLIMPDSFTPNRDGHNDVFRIPQGTAFNLYSLSVFDRWGNRVFATSDISSGWDGTYKGKPCNTGAYIYTISGSDGKKTVVLKGTLVLIR
jgi:gliding motility-associated-like protein